MVQTGLLSSLVAALLFQPLSQVGERWWAVEEYGFRVAYPGGARVCEGLTWAHLHGWAMPLGGDCEQMKRRITVWADWNAPDYRTPEEASVAPH